MKAPRIGIKPMASDSAGEQLASNLAFHLFQSLFSCPLSFIRAKLKCNILESKVEEIASYVDIQYQMKGF